MDSADNTVRLWDTITGENRRVLTGHTGLVASVAFNPDGRTLASGSHDGTILVWKSTSRTNPGDVNSDGTALLANYPNPFYPETWIPYRLPQAADVNLTIYDTKGAPVRRLDLGHQSAGDYTDRVKAAYWDGRNASGQQVASGIYFYNLSAGNYSATRKMLILK